MKQADLSRATGIPTSLISNYVNDIKSPTMTNAVLIAKAFNVTLDQLAGIARLDDGSLSPVKSKFLNSIDNLNEEGHEHLLDYTAYLVASSKFNKKSDEHQLVQKDA